MIAGAAVLFPFLIFQIGISYSVARVGATLPKISLQGITWMRDRTPETSGYADDKEPEYGVVCFWDQGNAITYLARRPVAVSNTLVGFRNMVKVLFAKDEAEAFQFCRKNKYRYLYMTALPGEEEYFRYLKGLAEEDGDSIEFDFRGGATLGDADETWKSLYFWLYGSLGLKKFGTENSVSRHFRIVYVSSDGSNGKDSSIKIAEVVPGATITGTVDPGTNVLLGLPIKFGHTVFPYYSEARADASGSFRLIVPYATDSKMGDVQTDSFYVLKYSAAGIATESRIAVSETAVITGGTIAMP